MTLRSFLSSLTLCLFLALPLSGCQSSLYGRIEKITSNSQAHEILKTPEPDDWQKPSGQRLIVRWNLPNRYSKVKSLQLFVDVIFSKGEHDLVKKDLNQNSGYWIYAHDQASLDKKGPIATYKIWVMQEGKKVTEFKHRLYREWLDLEELEEEIDI